MRQILAILMILVAWLPAKSQDPVLQTEYFRDSAKVKNVSSVTIREQAADSTVWGIYKLDTDGRIIEMEINGEREFLKYDKYGNRIFNSKNKRKYNSSGKIVWEQSSDLNYSIFHYDSLDRLTKEEFFLADGMLNQYWLYEYSYEGNLSKIKAYDPPLEVTNNKLVLGTTTTYQYGNWGMLNLYRFEYRMGGVNRRKYSYENGLPTLLENYDYDNSGNCKIKTYDILYEFGK